MSAASFATSTAPSTEMPTSAACSAGASLMPSPRKPTTCPRRLSARMIAVLLRGRDAAEQRRRLDARVERAVVQLARSRRRSGRRSTGKPSWRQTCSRDELVVAGHDLHRDAAPPRAAQRLARRSALGGSRKAAKPANTRSHLVARRRRAGRRRTWRSTRSPSTRKPSRLRASKRAVSALARLVVERPAPPAPSRSVDAQRRTSSGAPLTISSARRPVARPGPTRRRRSKSNGTSSILRPAADVRLLVAQDRVVERALEAGLEAAVEVRELKHARAVAPGGVDVLLEPDLRLGQRAGLVGAEHVHAAEVRGWRPGA